MPLGVRIFSTTNGRIRIPSLPIVPATIAICSGVTSWAQYYSIRNTARTCGQISVTEHFKAWAAAGLPLGKMDQAQILVEVGGGQGSIDFTTASMTAQ